MRDAPITRFCSSMTGRYDGRLGVCRPRSRSLQQAPRQAGMGLAAGRGAPGIFTSRAGLAASMLDQATDTRFVRKAAAVTTSEGAPTLFQMIRREALKKK